MPTLGENRCVCWIARRRKGLRPHGKSQRKYCRRLGTSSCRRAFDTPSKRRQLPGNVIQMESPWQNQSGRVCDGQLMPVSQESGFNNWPLVGTSGNEMHQLKESLSVILA